MKNMAKAVALMTEVLAVMVLVLIVIESKNAVIIGITGVALVVVVLGIKGTIEDEDRD
jgi:hypothetical protein